MGFSCFAGDNSPVASNCSKKVGDVHRNQLLSVTKNPVVVHSTNDTQEQINGYAAESCCVKETGNEKMKQNEGVVFRSFQMLKLSFITFFWLYMVLSGIKAVVN